MNINNNVQRLRREVIIHLIKLFDKGLLEKKIHLIPKLVAPDHKEAKSCCVFHDRAIIEQQLQNALGLNILEIDQELDLRELTSNQLVKESDKKFTLNLLSNACHSCPQERHLITNACRGCLARPCQMNCPKDAIYFENHRAVIDQSKCINCGRCVAECSYHAISYLPVPCRASCPVKAIDKNEKGEMMVDSSKCIACGRCMTECPFGALMPRSQLLQVLVWMQRGLSITAAVAPAIYGQFNSDKAQLVTALKKIGFTHVLPVARGAEQTIEEEASELAENIEEGKGPMTSSCCPAYVLLAKKHAPDLLPLISHTPSPMHFAGEMAKAQHPMDKVVFIGPCIGKMAEAENDHTIDAVITFEELGALLVAREIEILNLSKDEFESLDASHEADNFANSGGVGAAVLKHLQSSHPSLQVRNRTIDGLDKKNIALLKSFTKDKAQWDFTEVMSCNGGCVGGNCTLTTSKTASLRIKKITETKKPL